MCVLVQKEGKGICAIREGSARWWDKIDLSYFNQAEEKKFGEQREKSMFSARWSNDKSGLH